MSRRVRYPLAVASLVTALAAAATASEGWREVVGESYRFTEVREGIWHVQGAGSVAAGCNGALVVSADDVLLVDSHMTPAAARALLADLPRVTDKPIRYLVNTHFHFDHVQGNQVFGPEVEIIAHEFTRERVASGDSRRGRGYDFFIGTLPARIEALEAQLADADGEKRQEVEAELARLRSLWEQDRETELRSPTLALREAVTLYRGGREIRILHLGRGHTGGDVVVYLPADRALVTGDLVTAGIPYMGDGFLLEWAASLEPLQALDVEVILPGHGPAFEEVERIGHLQHYLRDLWHKVAEMHRLGVPAAEAAARIDMTDHADHFPTIDEPGVSAHAVERAYELLESQPLSGLRGERPQAHPAAR